jgi:eukaryotic-like serine/threonine-protein kinase
MTTDSSPGFLALQGALAGRYALERELGRGGMGIVYLARDLSLDRPVAIKVLPPALAALPALRERFLREARTAARLSHPNIVPIHAVEEHGALVLFVMGYVEGETLGRRVARAGPVPFEEAARILQEVAWALAYAHRHGVIHRDVKPDNILLERASGRALVSDFGIAQSSEAAGVSGAGEILGTARYMSPEQLAGSRLDGRSDLYGLGVTALQALSPTLPERLAPIVERCLQPDPADRYPDGEALAEALGAARGQQVVVPRPVERFADLYKTLGTEVASYAAILVVLAGETLALGSWGTPLFPTVLIYAFFVAVGLGSLRFMQLVKRARGLLGQGYSVGDVATALARPEEPPDERFHLVTGLDARLRRWSPRWLLAIEGVVGAGLWVAAWQWWAHTYRGPIGDGLLYALLTLVPVVLLRGLFARLLRPTRKGWWSKLWWKVMEWKVFKLAGLTTGRPAIAASEPTEAALGAGAQALFEAMPRELRARFAEVPAVLERLEQQAQRLRQAPGSGGRARLTSALAAMESLRLDLLRLGAGAGTPDDLTADLAAAGALTDRIEALVEAHRELGAPTPVPGG